VNLVVGGEALVDFRAEDGVGKWVNGVGGEEQRKGSGKVGKWGGIGRDVLWLGKVCER